VCILYGFLTVKNHTVRYLYNLHNCMVGMVIQSQTIMQDMYVTRPNIVCSSARRVICCICNKGLDAGYGLRAKTVGGKVVMYCERHYDKTVA